VKHTDASLSKQCAKEEKGQKRPTWNLDTLGPYMKNPVFALTKCVFKGMLLIY